MITQDEIDRLGPYCQCRYCTMLWFNPFKLLVNPVDCDCIKTGVTTDHMIVLTELMFNETLCHILD